MSKNHNYNSILRDEAGMTLIKNWIREYKANLSNSISASKLAQKLGDIELKRELVALLKVDTSSEDSLCESVETLLRSKNRLRKGLFPQLAIEVFGLDRSKQLNRLISFAEFDVFLRGLSIPVESISTVFASDGGNYAAQSEAIFHAADTLFSALDVFKVERQLIILRIICIIHLGFRWYDEVSVEGSDMMSNITEKFCTHLGVPQSERTQERLKADTNRIVTQILPTEQPLSVLLPNFAKWWETLFLEINKRGGDLLMELSPKLRLLSGNPFQLTKNRKGSCCDRANETEATQETDADSLQLDPATKAAFELRKMAAAEREKQITSRLQKGVKQFEPLVYDCYEGLSLSSLMNLKAELDSLAEKAEGVRSTLEKAIEQRAACDGPEDEK